MWLYPLAVYQLLSTFHCFQTANGLSGLQYLCKVLGSDTVGGYYICTISANRIPKQKTRDTLEASTHAFKYSDIANQILQITFKKRAKIMQKKLCGNFSAKQALASEHFFTFTFTFLLRARWRIRLQASISTRRKNKIVQKVVILNTGWAKKVGYYV